MESLGGSENNVSSWNPCPADSKYVGPALCSPLLPLLCSWSRSPYHLCCLLVINNTSSALLILSAVARLCYLSSSTACFFLDMPTHNARSLEASRHILHVSRRLTTQTAHPPTHTAPSPHASQCKLHVSPRPRRIQYAYCTLFLPSLVPTHTVRSSDAYRCNVHAS